MGPFAKQGAKQGAKPAAAASAEPFAHASSEAASFDVPADGPGRQQEKRGGTAKTKAAFKIVLKASLAAALIWYLVRAGALDFDAIAKLATPTTVSAIAGLMFVMIAINNYRWLVLLRAQGFPATAFTTLPLTYIGLFFNFAMPGGVGGDVVKGYYLLQEHPERRVAAALSIFMDRMSGFFVMLVTATLALFANWEAVRTNAKFQAVGSAVGALLICFVAFYAISFTSFVKRSRAMQWAFDNLPVGGALRHVYEGLHSYRAAPGALAASFGLSAISQLMMVAANAAVGSAMGLDVPWACYFFVVPVGTVITTLPISIAGIGVGQLAFFFLYKMYLGKETQLGPTAATAIQLATFALGLIGAVLYLRRGRPRGA